MDVRCEKCQTEYELDEARLKPGGVTVKCTNCGHMFKIRKRTPTSVGLSTGNEDKTRQVPIDERLVAASKPTHRADSVLDIPRIASDTGSGPTEQRQWLIRLENGEQKSCRELAVLQQWIVSGVVTRESLISRTGKTWKRLGDVEELGQYFVIADEARQKRERAATHKAGSPATGPAGTMLGVSTVPKAAGGTILPDDDEQTTNHYAARKGSTTPPPTPRIGGAKPPPTPAMGVKQVAAIDPRVDQRAQTEVMPPGSPAGPGAPTVPVRRPITQPPPIPQQGGERKTMLHANQSFPSEASNRSTGNWASEGMPGKSSTGPAFGGRLREVADEPAFAAGGPGKVRGGPADERGFETGKVRALDGELDDDDLMPGSRRGSSAGKWIVVVALLVMGAAAAVIYVVINKQSNGGTAKGPVDAGSTVATVSDAQTTVTPIVDGGAPVSSDPLEAARSELAKDDEARLKTAMASLDGKDDPGAQALRARLGAGLAQAMLDRANLLADKGEADKLRRDAKQLVIDAAPFAQRAFKAKPDDASANLAMAEILRLQNKTASDIKRYSDAARSKADPKTDKDLAREVALSDALVLARDGKLDDAQKAFVAIDAGEGKLEQSGDLRARFHLAQIALAQGKPADAKPLVDQVLAAAPEHAGSRALATKLETAVARTDPLPPEDGKTTPPPGDKKNTPPPGDKKNTPPTGDHGTPSNGGGSGSYDALLNQANSAAANTNCTRALELYGKALEIKPNGVEALAGQGYCHIDRKEFASAHSKFRAALAISSRFEPALFGIAEAYAQQGRKDDAIAAFRRYLDAYPGAAKAKRQLEMLGAGEAAPPPQGSAAPPAGSATPPAGSATPPAGSASGDDPG